MYVVLYTSARNTEITKIFIFLLISFFEVKLL